MSDDFLANPNAGVTPAADETKARTKPQRGLDWEYEQRRERDVENIWGRQISERPKRR